jgi:hypothetical protein
MYYTIPCDGGIDSFCWKCKSYLLFAKIAKKVKKVLIISITGSIITS